MRISNVDRPALIEYNKIMESKDNNKQLVSPVKRQDELPVSEIFYSIQGEGRFLGTPAIFLRLSYCNAGCLWCDSKFTWNVEHFESAKWYDVREISQQIERLLPSGIRKFPHIVITGGEPLIHQSALIEFGEHIKMDTHKSSKDPFFIEVETNCTIEAERELMDLVDWWNCSPKLKHSGIDEKLRLNNSVISKFVESNKADFKFVIKEISDVLEIENEYLNVIPSDRIFLSPEGSTNKEQMDKMKSIVEICLQKGWRFSPRLHTIIWGDERGK